jgi:hypothetical protein
VHALGVDGRTLPWNGIAVNLIFRQGGKATHGGTLMLFSHNAYFLKNEARRMSVLKRVIC